MRTRLFQSLSNIILSCSFGSKDDGDDIVSSFSSKECFTSGISFLETREKQLFDSDSVFRLALRSCTETKDNPLPISFIICLYSSSRNIK